MNFKDFVVHLKEQVSLEDYMGRYGVTLTPNGYRLKGLCPFHHEKTPSFMVDVNTQSYKCFGCGAHGDVIDLIVDKEALSFTDAIRMLAEENNITIPEGLFSKNGDTDKENHVDINMVRNCTIEAGRFYYRRFRELPEEHPAKQEILSRNLPVRSENFIYGYAPESWDSLYQHLLNEGYTPEVMLAGGLIVERKNGTGYFDRWRNRLMFFIMDVRGKPIGFTGRALAEGDNPKYSNSPETPLFKKSKALFNIDNAKTVMEQKKQVFVTEGQFDVASLYHAGVKNVVASSGTAFTSQQAHILDHYIKDGTIVFCFDGDKAGKKALWSVFKNLPELHDHALVVQFPANIDPCDYMKDNGAEQLKKFVNENQIPIVQALLKSLKENCEVSTVAGRNEFTRKAVSILAHIKNPIILKQGVREAALWALTGVKEVEQLIDEEIKKQHTPKHVTKEQDSAVDDEREQLINTSTEHDEQCLNALKHSDDFHMQVASKTLATYMRAGGGLELPNINTMPEQLHDIYTTLHTNDSKYVFYPEMFETTQTVSYMLTDDFMPFTPNMTVEDLKAHYEYLFKELQEASYNKAIDNVHAQTYRALEGDATVQNLIQAREIEQKLLNTIKNK